MENHTIKDILQLFNINMKILNRELSFLGIPNLPETAINAILRPNWYYFLQEYFGSKEWKNICNHYEVAKSRKSLQFLFLKGFRSYMNSHLGFGVDYLSDWGKFQLSHLTLQNKVLFDEYNYLTNGPFFHLVEWYDRWCEKFISATTQEESVMNKELEVVIREFKQCDSIQKRADTIDHEKLIYGALRDGNGDLFGF